jgi:hypothetical protein
MEPYKFTFSSVITVCNLTGRWPWNSCIHMHARSGDVVQGRLYRFFHWNGECISGANWGVVLSEIAYWGVDFLVLPSMQDVWKNWLYKMSRVSTLLKFLLRSLRSRCMTFPTWLGCRICSDCKSLRSSIAQSSSRCRDQVLPEYALPTVSFYLQHTILLIAAGNQKFSHMSSSCASNLVNEVEEATRSLDAHARAPSWSL